MKKVKGEPVYEGDTDGETYQWEMFNAFPGHIRGDVTTNPPARSESSGVTTVLEAAETERHSGVGTTSEGNPFSADNQPSRGGTTSDSDCLSGGDRLR